MEVTQMLFSLPQTLPRVLFLVSAISLAAPLSSAPAQDDVPTARDLFLEGWFHETAEKNLDAAVRAYERCLALDPSSDPDIVSKALMRLGHIALARKQDERAQGFFQRVQELFPQSAAATEARAALTSPKPDSPAQSRTERALQALDGICASSTTAVGAQAARLIFTNLTANQIFERIRENEAHPWTFLTSTREHVASHLAKAVELATLSGHAATAEAIVLAVRGVVGIDKSLLLPLVPLVEKQNRDRLFQILSASTDAETLQGAQSLIAQMTINDLRSLEALTDNPSPEAAALMDRVLEKFDLSEGGRSRLAYVASPNILTSQSAAAQRLRREFPSLPTYFRHRTTTIVCNPKSNKPSTPPCAAALEMLVSDAEPLVRYDAALWLVRQSDGASHKMLLNVLAQARKNQRAGLIRRIVDAPTPPSFTEILDALPRGAWSELYLELLESKTSVPGRSLGQILDDGLSRAPTLLVEAVFGRERSWNLEELTDKFWTALETSPDPSPMVRFVKAAANSKREPIRKSVAEFLWAVGENFSLNARDANRWLKTSTEFAAIVDGLANDPSPYVRSMTLNFFEALPLETKTRLCLDEDELIHSKAIEAVRAPEVLESIAREIALERRGLLGRFVSTCHKHRALDPLKILLERGDFDASIRRKCYQDLVDVSADAIISALSEEDVRIRRLAMEAIDRSGFRDGAEPFQRELARARKGSHVREVLSIVAKHKDELQSALRQRQIDICLDQPERGVAPLVEHEARDELYRLALGAVDNTALLASHGLATLGDRDRLIQAFETRSRPDPLVLALVMIGEEDRVLEMLRRGRVTARRYSEALAHSASADRVAKALKKLDTSEWARVSPELLRKAMPVLVEERDTETLLRALMHSSNSTFALNGLFRLEAYSGILEVFAELNHAPTQRVIKQLHGLTGKPEWYAHNPNNVPQYEDARHALVREWREALSLQGK